MRYTATVYIDWSDHYGDVARVVVDGHRYREDHHWSDTLAGHARRAVLALFNVDRVVSVESSRTTRPAGAVARFTVKAA